MLRFIKNLTMFTYLLLFLVSGLSQAIETPNDTLFDKQWSLDNTGQSGGLVGADIRALAAWGIFTGEEAIVAVIGTGVALTHEDLENKIISGYDFRNEDNDPNDDQGDGTLSAGIIAAEAHNAKGIAGICQRCRIMPIKTLDENHSGDHALTADGIRYAIEQGASVIHLGLGLSENAQAIQTVIQQAYDANVVIVAAAGDSGTPVIAYPAKLAETIAVGASDHEDKRWSASSYGPELDLVAPGEAIHSTAFENNYANISGTAAAAALVAGAVGVLQSFCQTHFQKQLSPEEVRLLLSNSADDLGPPGWDEEYGAGRLNLEALLQLAQSWCKAPPHTLTLKVTTGGQIISDPEGIQCTEQHCHYNDDQGTPVTLIAQAADGYFFEAWGGDCYATTPIIQIDLDRPYFCTASFRQHETAPPTRVLPATTNLTINFKGNGRGHVNQAGSDCNTTQDTCHYTYDTATWTTLTATPAANSTFLGWGGHQDCVDGKLFFTGSRTCTAYFELLPVTLTIATIGKGTVHLSPTALEQTEDTYAFVSGTEVTLTASSADNWQFEHWQGACDEFGQVILDKDKTCQAVFSPIEQPVISTAPPTPPDLKDDNVQIVEEPVLSTLHVSHNFILLPDTNTLHVLVDVADALITLTDAEGEVLATAFSIPNAIVTLTTTKRGDLGISVTKAGYSSYQGILLASTVTSDGQGHWTRTPELNDIAVIQAGHTVVVARYGNFVRADKLYIETGGVLQGAADKRLTVLVEELYNYGEIRGASGTDGFIAASGDYVYATYGKSITLKADTFIVNGTTGRISAGQHGENFSYHPITHQTIKIPANDTGWLDIVTPFFINEGVVTPALDR